MADGYGLKNDVSAWQVGKGWSLNGWCQLSTWQNQERAGDGLLGMPVENCLECLNCCGKTCSSGVAPSPSGTLDAKGKRSLSSSRQFSLCFDCECGVPSCFKLMPPWFSATMDLVCVSQNTPLLPPGLPDHDAPWTVSQSSLSQQQEKK